MDNVESNPAGNLFHSGTSLCDPRTNEQNHCPPRNSCHQKWPRVPPAGNLFYSGTSLCDSIGPYKVQEWTCLSALEVKENAPDSQVKWLSGTIRIAPNKVSHTTKTSLASFNVVRSSEMGFFLFLSVDILGDAQERVWMVCLHHRSISSVYDLSKQNQTTLPPSSDEWLWMWMTKKTETKRKLKSEQVG